jgi:hypothetical protein
MRPRHLVAASKTVPWQLMRARTGLERVASGLRRRSGNWKGFTKSLIEHLSIPKGCKIATRHPS